MPVCPIDYGRYGHPDMVRIFKEEFRHGNWLRVESTVAQVQADMGIIPNEAAEEIAAIADPETVTLERTMEIEARTRHDIAALVEAIAEKCEGVGARWVHFGLTSNDIKDTARGLQLLAAYGVLMPELDALSSSLSRRAIETQDLVAVGRSHGQQAVPITYGIRFSVWVDEIRRHAERLCGAMRRTAVGKIAGATGSHAALGPRGIDLQERVLIQLGLNVPAATTQIVQRDRIAESILCLANLASSLDKMATDLRNLQRTEIGETYEPFATGKQVGSSAMPHKRNPVTCEKVSGIARLVRSLAHPALENVISWEERDISHSSTERFVIPQAFILTDYIVREMKRVIEGLIIDEEAVRRNLGLTRDTFLSEYLMTVLIEAGLSRPEAHAKMRALTLKAKNDDADLLDTLKKDSSITRLMDPANIDVNKFFDSIREVSRQIVRETLQRYEDSMTSSTG
jgi:adenylosuccinate lyase